MYPQRRTPTRPTPALLVGTEHILLLTRKAILEKENFVVSIASPSDVSEELQRADYAVVISCHTLTEHEQQSLIAAARSLPQAPALVAFTRRPYLPAASIPFDASVWSLASPQSFVNKVRQALNQRQS